MRTSITRATAARRLGAVLCLALTGCSVVAVQRARPPAEVEDPRVLEPCTTSAAAPIADTVLAAAALGVGYVALAIEMMAPCSRCERDGAPALAALATGGVFLGSALFGHVNTARCRHARVDGRRCANGDAWSCHKRSPGWTPPPGWRAPGAVLEPASPAPAAAAPGPQPGAHDPSSSGTVPDDR